MRMATYAPGLKSLFAGLGLSLALIELNARAGPPAGQPNANVLLDGVESRSRLGNQEGSINDDNLQSLVTTCAGKCATEDWFDTSAGKPRVQIQRVAGSALKTIGELGNYPAIAATSGQCDRLTGSNRSFTLLLTKPMTFTAVRVIGMSDRGDNPQQAFSSCAEPQAFSE